MYHDPGSQDPSMSYLIKEKPWSMWTASASMDCHVPGRPEGLQKACLAEVQQS